MPGLESILSQALGWAAPSIKTNDPVLTSSLQWLAMMQQHVLGRWRTVATSGIRCGIQVQMRSGEVFACTHPAVSACAACERPACLGHGAVDIEGNVVCLACMAGFVAKAKAERAKAPPPAAPVDETEERKRHLRALGLKEPADWDEVHTAFRKLAAKWHPDKHQEPGKKAAADKKFREINAAYQWLGQRLRKAA